MLPTTVYPLRLSLNLLRTAPGRHTAQLGIWIAHLGLVHTYRHCGDLEEIHRSHFLAFLLSYLG